MGNRDAVVIEFDSAPPPSVCLQAVTTSSVVWFRHCSGPALRLLSATRASDYLEFDVEDGRRFCDGSPVQPRHVLQTLIASASSLQWARQIAYLEKAEIIGTGCA